MAPFGAIIPVTGLNQGFPGSVTRLGLRGILARQVKPSTTNPIYFGQGVVMVPDATGGTIQSIADFIALGGTFTAPRFAGVAVREVKTNLTFPTTPGATPTGSYAQGGIGEYLVDGYVLVNIANGGGSAVAGGTVYVRTALNGSIPAGLVGDFEAVADGGNTVALSGVYFRTGVQDANGSMEIVMPNRVSA